ncbi:MAG: helix-turn-helix domain-containing protein [Candidatus Woesearchaeota archaeon]|nr:helix-turn-helix domain-containing protein [Candidatus Woesearchaeota archaeon]
MINTVILERAGLTSGEARTYLALIEIGESTTGPIVQKANIAKSIVYSILNKLAIKGLVSYVIKNKTKYFQAAEPRRLLDFIELRKKELDQTAKQMREFIKQLATARQTPESTVKVFTGFKGLITVSEHTYDHLARGEEYLCLNIPADQPSYFHSFWQKDHAKRIRAGIKCRLLFDPDTEIGILKNRNSYRGCDARFMPTRIKSPVWFMVYKNISVISFATENPLTIEIKNEKISASFKAYFEEFWKKTSEFVR